MWVKNYDVEFAHGEELLVFAELYEVEKPMRRLGQKIFTGSATPERLSVKLFPVYKNDAKNIIAYTAVVKLGEQILEIPEFTITSLKWLNETGYGCYQGEGLRKDYTDIKSLFTFYKDNFDDKRNKFWVPGSHTTATNMHHEIIFRMIPVSRAGYLLLDEQPATGRQGLDGKPTPPDLTWERAKQINQQYKQTILDTIEQLEAKNHFSTTLPNGIIVELLNVSDGSGDLTINSIRVAELDGEKLSLNTTSIFVDVVNNSDREVNLGLAYYTYSGKAAIFFSPGASAMAMVRKVGPNWQGMLEFPMNYHRFAKGGYVKITLAKCSSDLIEGVSLPQGVEVIHEKQYNVISASQQKQVVELLKTLRTAKGRDRFRAAEKLSKYSRSVVPAIIPMLQDNNVWAAYALGEIGPEAEDAVPALIKSLTQGGVGGIRGFSASALRKIGPAAVPAIPALIESLKDEHYSTRMHAADALGILSTGEKDVIDALTTTLKDENEKVRKEAAWALKQIQERYREDKTQNSPFTATLPNGVTVELVGVCEHPSDGKPWWRPDGSLLKVRPYAKLNDREAYNDLRMFEIVYRLSGPGKAVSKIIRTDEMPGYLGPYDMKRDIEKAAAYSEDCVYAMIPVVDGLDEVDINIACGTEVDWQWHTRVTSPVTNSGMNTDQLDLSVSTGEQGYAVANVTHRIYDKEVRVIAKDKSGKLYHPKSLKGKTMDWAGVITAKFDISADDIESVEVQTQEFQTVEFKNVSLQSGYKTAVQVDTGKGEQMKGWVVDTAGAAIEGAIVNFTRLENYKDDQGHTRQRTLEIGADQTNVNGEFIFKNIPKSDAITYDDLNVFAEGFADRNELALSHRPDGRYQWLQDNIVKMQRPAIITGKGIGADSGPLANAELRFSQNNHYTYARDQMLRTIKTDDQGNFILDSVTSGHHLLSFTKYKLVELPAGGSRREYGGKCGAIIVEIKEGQNLNNVVLDMSKSVCSMEVEAVDKDGKPVDNVSFTFEIEMPQTSQYVYMDIFSSSQSNPQGLYVFEGLPMGKFFVRAYNKKLGSPESIEANLLPNQTTRFKIQFQKSLEPNQIPDVQVEGEKTNRQVEVKKIEVEILAGNNEVKRTIERTYIVEDYGQTRLLSNKEWPDFNWVSIVASVVKDNGRYLVPDNGLTLKELIKAAGYNKDKLDESYVTVSHETKQWSQRAFKLYSRNLETLFSGKESDIPLKHGNGVTGGYVGPSPNAEEFWGRYHFGDVIEMTVNDDNAKTNMFADLDAGKLVTTPATLDNTDENAVLTWIKENGIDVMGETAGSVHGLVGFNIYAIHVDNYFWDVDKFQITDRLLASMDEIILLSVDNVLPVTYLINTSEHTMGVLQILGYAENPKGIKIRYKLLQKTDVKVEGNVLAK